MTSQEFIFQGLTTRSHGAVLSEVFAIPDLSNGWLSVAFVTSNGVEMARPVLSAHAERTTVYAGIRNGITSVQGMKGLLQLGVKLYAVDTGRATLVFHPKIYAAAGAESARLLVGSANLTAGGLQNNFEASLLMNLSLLDGGDRTLFESMTGVLSSLPAHHSQNVTEVTTDGQLDTMLEQGRLCDEAAPIPPVLRSAATISKVAGDSVPVMRTLRSGQLPRRKVAVLPKIVQRTTVVPLVPAAAPVPASYVEVWRIDGLTHRDLNIPGPGWKLGARTNLTGSINLDKGELPDDVDFQTYFRDDVFAELPWQPSARGIETAPAHFRLVVKGIDRGDFVLIVRHSTEAQATRAQGNALTRLSWGTAKPHVADPSLVGRSLTLSQDVSDMHRFLIEID